MSAVSHCIDDMDGKGTDQNQWDEHLDAVLLTYRVLPIDRLDISPFEIIYGRGPNLPIDNILFRENYDGTMMHETQLNMYEALNLARKERFERNKKNSSQAWRQSLLAIPKRALAPIARLDHHVSMMDRSQWVICVSSTT